MATRRETLPLFPGGGRHINHDDRSLAYAAPVLPKSAIRSVAWARRVPIFDQGQLGSCTGETGAGWIVTDNATRQGLSTLPDGTPCDQSLAVKIYSEATAVDDYKGTYPPTDTGSDGLSVAKVLKTRGLVSSYSHAFSIDALYAALQDGPVMIGIPWYNSCFDAAGDGRIPVVPGSGLAGGHEILGVRLDVPVSGVVEKVWIDNSWGRSWGLNGSGYFTPSDLAALLGADGDVTVPKAIKVPAPTPPAPDPTPVPPAPPGPGKAYTVTDPAVISRVSRAAVRAHLSEDAWVSHNLAKYFDLKS